MRNLRTTRHDILETAAGITSICWQGDFDSGTAIVTLGPTTESSKLELARLSQWGNETIASWDVPSPNPDLAVDKVVSIHQPSHWTTYLVFAGGDIIAVREDEDGDEAHVEVVGSIDAGITAARWSPDGELLIITTTVDTVVFMSQGLDVIVDAAMTSEDLKSLKHVSVGWGKRETQFEGRGAKALIDPTIPRKADEGILSPNDDRSTSISWRGDGAFVAVNTLQGNSRRTIRVYTREGALDSVSEPVDGLEGGLSWRPSGNLMAGVQRFTDRSDVVFFERNGLRHGQFTLRPPESVDTSRDQIRLEWNSDSTVLAVVYPSVIQLWTMSNYYWYLKQEIFTAPPCSSFVFHPDHALNFMAATSNGVMMRELTFIVTRGSLVPPDDHGAVAVVDGKMVKLTAFRTANVPPPMSMFELSAGSTVIDVSFAQKDSAIAVLHHRGVDIYAWETKGARSLPPQYRSSMRFDEPEQDSHDRPAFSISFPGGNEFQLLHITDELAISTYACESSDGEYQLVATQSCRPGTIIGPIQDGASPGTFSQEGERFFRVSRTLKEPLGALADETPLPEVVVRNGEPMIFGLLSRGNLFRGLHSYDDKCISFLLTPKHLIMTTSNHLLKFIHLADLKKPNDDPENDERCRRIERGARLITAVPTNMSLVLQMPRGNLETIYPRAMVLAGIRQLIDEKDYGKAFEHCRTHRVDMNILYDHQPQQFLSSIGLFLDQLKDLSSIDLFLSSLKEENVTQTMYTDTLPQEVETSSASKNDSSAVVAPRDSPEKINAICDAVVESLQARKNGNLQNIITAHVCKSPPAYDNGLLVVADLMKVDETLAERAVGHICFLVDVNRLYDHALGLYNLDLALLVAQQSQRDPREYLPFIQSLHEMPELRRQFTIDDHLEHYEKALDRLKSLGEFEEVSDYTAKHLLYRQALRLYRYEPERHRALTDLYAAYLQLTSQFRDAGLAYESLGDNAKATSCYRAAGAVCWQECLFTAQQQTPRLSAPALAELASALADALWEAKDFASAATVQLEYLASPEAAIRCLCRGYLFAEAMRLAAQRGRPDLLESAIDTGLADALSSSTELLADCKAQLLAQVPRFAELRRKAVEDPLGFYEGERPGGEDDDLIPDNVSVAASSRLSMGASLFTRYTGKDGSVGTAGTGVSRATSKNRRREEKKRARGRKGTVYEEEYLINSLRRLVGRVESARGEVERLAFALVRRGMAERARAVEALMAELVDACRVAIAEVWPTAEAEAEDKTEAAEREHRPRGADAVLQESLDARNAKQQAPVITGLARLSLLA